MTTKQKKAAIYRDVDAIAKKYNLETVIFAADVDGALLAQMQGPSIYIGITLARLEKEFVMSCVDEAPRHNHADKKRSK